MRQKKNWYLCKNISIHTSRIASIWFEDNSDLIEALKWPAKSPDLNPIENVWAMMVLDWGNSTVNRNRVCMREQVQLIWIRQQRRFCNNLVSSEKIRRSNNKWWVLHKILIHTANLQVHLSISFNLFFKFICLIKKKSGRFAVLLTPCFVFR